MKTCRSSGTGRAQPDKSNGGAVISVLGPPERCRCCLAAGERHTESVDVGVPELLIILAVVLLVFGSKKLPELARSLGQASKEFRKGTRHEEEPPDSDASSKRPTETDRDN
jgi:sec-independent protein translocase protein TatA